MYWRYRSDREASKTCQNQAGCMPVDSYWEANIILSPVVPSSAQDKRFLVRISPALKIRATWIRGQRCFPCAVYPLSWWNCTGECRVRMFWRLLTCHVESAGLCKDKYHSILTQMTGADQYSFSLYCTITKPNPELPGHLDNYILHQPSSHRKLLGGRGHSHWVSLESPLMDLLISESAVCQCRGEGLHPRAMWSITEVWIQQQRLPSVPPPSCPSQENPLGLPGKSTMPAAVKYTIPWYRVGASRCVGIALERCGR